MKPLLRILLGACVAAPEMGWAAGGGDGPVAPVPFVENLGQLPGHVGFLAQVNGTTSGGDAVRLSVRAERGAVVVQAERRESREGAVARLEFVDGVHWTPVGLDVRPERHHVFLGNDPSLWIRDVRGFDRVGFEDEVGALRAELVLIDGRLGLQAIGSAAPIAMRTLGSEAVAQLVDLCGAPWATIPGEVWSVDCGPLGLDADEGASQAAFLDIGLTWSTYLGGALGIHDRMTDAAVFRGDPMRVVACGNTDSADFPIAPGAYTAGPPGSRSVAVASFDAASGAAQWTTVVGGMNTDAAEAIGVDADGNVVVGGRTISFTFPTTPGAHQETHTSNSSRGFVFKLRADGSDLVYSTYLGGPAPMAAYGMALRSDGAAVIVGEALAGFPTTPGVYQPQLSEVGGIDAFVLVLSPDGSDLEWSTYLGAKGLDYAEDVAIGPDGTVTVVGVSGTGFFPTTPGAYVWNKPPLSGSSHPARFVTRLTSDGSALVWSAMMGWPGGQNPLQCIAVGPHGETVFGGSTWGTPVPVVPGCVQTTFQGGGFGDGYIGVLSPDGSTLTAGMYCGGPGSDAVSSVHIDQSGVITVGGSSALPGLAALTEPILSPSAAPAGGAYVGRYSPDLTRSLYGALFGGITGFKGTGIQGVAPLPRGALATAGVTTTKDFPTSPGAVQPDAPGGQNDGFVAVHRMLPVGVFAVGRSGPEANREAYLGATGPAQAGNGGFALYASCLPPSTHGVLAIGRPAHTAFPLGDALLHVHPRGIALVPWFTGPRGYSVLDLPLPTALASQELAAQILLASPSGDLSWTHGLHLTIAP